MPLLAWLLAPLVFAAAPLPKVDARLAPAFAKAPRQLVIVELVEVDPSPALREPRVREAELSARKDEILSRLALSGRLVRRWPSFRLVGVEAGSEDVAALARDKGVAFVHFNRQARPLATTSFGFTGATAYHARGAMGAGTAVAVLDSTVRYNNNYFGTCPKPGAAGCSVSAVLNFSPDDPTSVAQGEPHGTNVAGIVLGMAPAAKIFSLNVFHYDAPSHQYVSDLGDELDALQWVADNAATNHIVAANMSLGTSENLQQCNSDPLYDPFRLLFETSNVLVTVASGNEGLTNGVGTPACVSVAVTVGAQYDLWADSVACVGRIQGHPGDLACFSNRDGLVDLVAPGWNIDAGGINGYSGTSMAAPHVAGAIALLQSARLGAGQPLSSAEELHRQLILGAVPRLFGGWWWSQLHLDPDAPKRDGRVLARWSKESAQNAIPAGGLTVSLDTSGWGRRVHGTYLYIEVVHPKPEDLEGTLTSPEGKSVTFRLPGGESNFIGVVGHTVQPGAFASLDGGPLDGTWKLLLRDTGTSPGGNLLEAAVYWSRDGCSAGCEPGFCGDDACGGSCAVCIIDEECLGDGTRAADSACWACDTARSSTAWSGTTGEECDDDNVCTRTDRCLDGVCTGSDPIVCTASDQCHSPGSCDPATGVCALKRLPDGTACDDGNPCTEDDACELGGCFGQPARCPAQECRASGACDPQKGGCQPGTPLANGTACSKGKCKDGACKSGCGCAAGSEPMLAVLLALVALARRGRYRLGFQ